MADLKTRRAVKGTVKTIDRAAVAAERLKSAAVRTKDAAERSAVLLRRLLRRSTALSSWSARRKGQAPSWASNSGSGAAVVFLMHGEMRTRQGRKCKNAGTY